jgi:dipeptidase E
MMGEPFLDYPKQIIADFLGDKPINALFIPYAGVSISWDRYENKVKERFNEIGHNIVSIHHFDNPIKAIEDTEAIVVGGGNTWNLLRMVQKNKLTDAIRTKILTNTKYIGWSAGSNIACPTIKTTNDMPIVEVDTLNALNLIPFQINPHFIDTNPTNFGGETREDRILEFLEKNRQTTVVGLREGCMLLIANDNVKYIGKKPLRIFKYNNTPYEIDYNNDFNFLIN